MATSYKLTYFNLRARAEPTRLVFAYAGVDYEDIRYSFENPAEEWLPVKKSKCWYYHLSRQRRVIHFPKLPVLPLLNYDV